MSRHSAVAAPCACHAAGPQRPTLCTAPLGDGAELQVRPAARGPWLVVTIQRWHTRQGRRHVARSSPSGVPAVTGRIVIRAEEVPELAEALAQALVNRTA